MKIIITFLIIAYTLSSQGFHSSYAGNESTYTSNKTYFSPNYSPKLEYSIDGDYINFSWEKAENNEFRYYKLVYSKTNSNLKYPDDKTVFIGSTKQENTQKVKYNGGYWRVCHVFEGYYSKGQDTNYTACSNIVSLDEKESSNYSESKNTDSTMYNKTNQKSQISDEKKKKSDIIITSFKKNLDATDLSDSEKAKTIRNIITKLQEIKKSRPDLSSLITYLIMKLEELESGYSDGFSDIESLFDL